MSLDDKSIEPQIIYEYIVSRNILDKKTMSEALDTYNKRSEPKISFQRYLVDKKLVHQASIEKMLEELSVKPTKEKDYTKAELLDQDVSDILTKLEEENKQNKKNLNELLEPSETDINRFFSPTGIDWQGRRMSNEDQESLIKKVATIKANDEVSKTNGVFVLNWMSNLLDI